MTQTTPLQNSDIHVFSISLGYLMRMGKVKGMGMPSIFAFHRELARRGFHVTFLQAGSIKEKDLDTEYENLTVHQVRNWRLPEFLSRIRVIRGLLAYPILFMSAFFPFLRYLRRQKRQGRHMVLYGQQAQGAVMASVIALLLRVPNVTRLYGSLLPYYFGLSPQYPVGQFRRYLNLLLAREETLAFIMPASKYVITNDGTLGDELFRALHRQKLHDRLEFVRNGVDMDWEKCLTKRRDRSVLTRLFGNDAPVVVTAGRLMPWKRMDRIIEIADRVRETGRLLNFLIMGNGELKDDLRQEIHARGLEDRVHIKTDTPHAQMPDFLLSADIVLLTQDYTNLSNTLMESMVLERPIVALDVGGTGKYVARNEENCLLVALDTVIEDAVAAILRVLDEPDLGARLAQGCRTWKVEHAYTWAERVEVDTRIIHLLVGHEQED